MLLKRLLFSLGSTIVVFVPAFGSCLIQGIPEFQNMAELFDVLLIFAMLGIAGFVMTFLFLPLMGFGLVDTRRLVDL